MQSEGKKLSSKVKKKTSRMLTYILRHNPAEFGVAVDRAGWAKISDLLGRLQEKGLNLSRAELEDIVATSDKQRFAISDDGELIRANQGHSFDVDLGYEPVTPPDVLYHGTAEHLEPSISAEGLKRGGRHHVHLSDTYQQAILVGRRHGKPIVYRVDAKGMVAKGYEFFCTPNDVWLTNGVPPMYLSRVGAER